MSDDPRPVDDIASGHGNPDLPPRTSDEKAAQMIQAGGTSGADAPGLPGSGVPDVPAPVNALPNLAEDVEVTPGEPKLEDPASGDPYSAEDRAGGGAAGW